MHMCEAGECQLNSLITWSIGAEGGTEKELVPVTFSTSRLRLNHHSLCLADGSC